MTPSRAPRRMSQENITAIFGKLGLAKEGSGRRRVAAALVFLGERCRPLGCCGAATGSRDAMIGLERP